MARKASTRPRSEQATHSVTCPRAAVCDGFPYSSGYVKYLQYIGSQPVCCQIICLHVGRLPTVWAVASHDSLYGSGLPDEVTRCLCILIFLMLLDLVLCFVCLSFLLYLFGTAAGEPALSWSRSSCRSLLHDGSGDVQLQAAGWNLSRTSSRARENISRWRCVSCLCPLHR
jgi:hypothetical protein